MNPFRRIVVTVCMSIVMLSAVSSGILAQQKPNIIFLLADDLRYNSLGCKGNTILQTPNIDKLAAAGSIFNNAFVTTPICCVSRASILSGQYSNRHNINDFVTNFSPEALSNTYPLIMRKNGYYTGFIGKYGVGNSMPVHPLITGKVFPARVYIFIKMPKAIPFIVPT